MATRDHLFLTLSVLYPLISPVCYNTILINTSFSTAPAAQEFHVTWNTSQFISAWIYAPVNKVHQLFKYNCECGTHSQRERESVQYRQKRPRRQTKQMTGNKSGLVSWQACVHRISIMTSHNWKDWKNQWKVLGWAKPILESKNSLIKTVTTSFSSILKKNVLQQPRETSFLFVLLSFSCYLRTLHQLKKKNTKRTSACRIYFFLRWVYAPANKLLSRNHRASFSINRYFSNNDYTQHLNQQLFIRLGTVSSPLNLPQFLLPLHVNMLSIRHTYWTSLNCATKLGIHWWFPFLCRVLYCNTFQSLKNE